MSDEKTCFPIVVYVLETWRAMSAGDSFIWKKETKTCYQLFYKNTLKFLESGQW